jgi:Zn-dependent protease
MTASIQSGTIPDSLGGLLDHLTPDRIAMGLTAYVVLLFSLSVHESAHAWMAHKMGDDTALALGRVSLNPIVHIDPIGTLLFPLIQIFTGIPTFGWAKPTPYNPSNFRRDVSMRQGHMLVAGAGPVSNLLLALLFTAVFFVIIRAGVPLEQGQPLVMIVVAGIQMNVVLAIFNLVPIPPLDGSKVASYGLPGSFGDRYDRVMEPYGFMILLLLMVTGLLSYVISPITTWVMFTLFSMVR